MLTQAVEDEEKVIQENGMPGVGVAGWLGELVGLKPEDSGRQVEGDEARQLGCDEASEYQTEESVILSLRLNQSFCAVLGNISLGHRYVQNNDPVITVASL